MKTAERRDGMMICACAVCSGSLYLFSLRAFNSRGAAAACRERYAAAFALYKYFIPAFIWIERVGYQ